MKTFKIEPLCVRGVKEKEQSKRSEGEETE